jgi:predicted ATPase/class 3 adenylate cyclase
VRGELRETIDVSSDRSVVGADDRALTFLFTDVVGSTRLWEEQPGEMGRAMKLHDAVLVATMSDHNVVGLKNTGDGFMGVFNSAADAVSAAVAIQAALMSQDWLGGIRPEVRSGIHTGSATMRDDDYFGATVNRAARVEEVAHGGQIILSLATADLVRQPLGATVRLVDLGTHRLRDLARPVQLFQAAAAGLKEEFPPLRTLDQFRHNLPVEWSSFVGRESDLRDVAKLIENYRLVTLHGPGGAGKTRLSLQVAAERIDDHPDGIWLTRLDTIDADDDVVHAVAGAVGAVASGTHTVDEALTDWGRNRDALLLLDSCEHVVDGVARLVARLLGSCPQLRVLATGREGLGLTGEAVHGVGPMPRSVDGASAIAVAASDAGALFLDRSRAVKPGFEITDDNAAAVSRICDRLDGIPLAIELAASRLKVLSPVELERRLDDRFRLLAGGDRTAMPRHRTLRATVEWSYDLLGDDERALFDRLSVFRGGFTLEAAEMVAGTGSLDVLGLLSRLVDRSMVTVTQADVGAETRFGMLDTLRDFAVSRLQESGEVETYRGRLVEFVVDMSCNAVVALQGPEESEWLERLDAEYPNIRRAVTWALSEGWFNKVHQVAGNLKMFFIARDEIIPEARSWIESAVDDVVQEPSVFLANALSTGGILAWSVGDLAEADRLQGRSLHIARELGGADEVFRATGDLGLIAIDRGDLDRARTLFEEGLDLARDRSRQGDVAVALANLAHVVPGKDQEELIVDALRIHRETGRLTGTAHMSLMLGWLHMCDGHLASARDWFGEGLQGFQKLGNQGSEVEALCGLADVALQEGDRDSAAESVTRAEDLARNIDWPGATALASTRRAFLMRLDDPSGALEVLDRVGVAWAQSGLDAGIAENLGLRSLVALDLGLVAAAAEWCAESSRQWTTLRRGAGRAWAATIAAEVERNENGPEAALALYGEALGAYSAAQRDPHTIDGFLAPGPGTRSKVIDAMERAALCSLLAGREPEGIAAMAAAAQERRRTGIVANDGLRDAVAATGTDVFVPSGQVPTFDAALRQAADAFLRRP